MTQKQQSLINELINLLPDDEKNAFEKISYHLTELGYIPQKQNVKGFSISFKHKINGKVIAKMGIGNQKGAFKLKFFACRDVPAKYIKALRDEIDSHNNQYSLPVPPPERDTERSNMIMKKCTLLCSICTGGGMRYYYQYPDGKEIFRCGAYPVLIPDINQNDMDELKRLILEQHNYFLSIA